MSEIRVIDGPTAPVAGRVMYQVTLSHGVVMTNPAGWGEMDDGISVQPATVVAETGQVLSDER